VKEGREVFMTDIEKCRALTVAMNSLRFNPKLSTIEVQSHETALRHMITEIEDDGRSYERDCERTGY